MDSFWVFAFNKFGNFSFEIFKIKFLRVDSNKKILLSMPGQEKT